MDRDERLRKIQERTMELCESDAMDPDVEDFARDVWLEAQDCAMHAVSKERMVAFAEMLFDRRHS